MTVLVEQAPERKGRILSLDVLRGIVIAFMILVNDNGSEQYAYAQLKHSAWNGWTLTDLVFPSFLFMVGITTVFSMQGRLKRGATRRQLFLHLLVRAVVLFCFGLVINGFPFYHLATLRIYGVLQRIAICYFIVGCIYLLSRRAITFVATAVVALLGYYILMRFVPVPGYGVPTHQIPLLDPDRNWVAWLDRHIFPGRLYQKVRDPEGLLSDIPAVATTALGVLAGMWLRTARTAKHTLAGLMGGAVAGIVCGEIWNVWFPINKKLWTSSYVLFAAGCTLLMLSICYALLDLKKDAWKGWTLLWLIFGSNAITAYMISELMAGGFNAIRVHAGGRVTDLQTGLYLGFFQHIGSYAFGSLLYSLSFVAVCFVPVLVLFRRKIFLRV